MAWSQWSLARMLLLGLLAPLSAAAADGKDKADGPPAGSADGFAYEEIEKVQIYTDNATHPGGVQRPPVDGWWDAKICSADDNFCVFTNRRVGKGRGLVAVTKPEDLDKLERFEEIVSKGENRYLEDPPPFEEVETPDRGVAITATKAIRRAKPLMAWTPVLLAHKGLWDKGGPKKKERARLLEAAVGFLPAETRAAFDKQRRRPGDAAGLNPRSIAEILRAHPFEVDLGYTFRRDESEHSKHYLNFPEASVLQHDCRPNVAAYIDTSFSLRATVARRVQPGEELTVSYVDPFLPREDRDKWVRRNRSAKGPDGKPRGGCTCRACAGADAAEADARLQEILELRAELRNHDSKKVTFDMIERFVKLYEEDRLHFRYQEAYELAALNFNYLGDDKRAKKYADKAVQAGIVEGGLDSNDVVAMRIMASDVKAHYSYKFTLKRRGLA